MTHQDWYIRSTASNCFAVLIKYYALNVRMIKREITRSLIIDGLEQRESNGSEKRH